MSANKKICSKGLWNDTVPGITFDENSVSNYAEIFQQMLNDYPRGEKAKTIGIKLFQKLNQMEKTKNTIA